MYRNTTILKHVYLGVIIILAAAAIIVPTFADRILEGIFAATLNQADLTISDSRADQTAVTYSFDFRVGTTTSVQYARFIFCQSTSGSCVTPTGLDTTSSALSSSSLPDSGTTTLNNSTNGTLIIDPQTPSATNTSTTYEVNFTGVTNPTGPDESFYVKIITYSDAGTTEIDSAWVAAAVLTDTSITMTADIGPSFTFTVAGVDYNSDGSGIGLTSGYVNGSQLNITTTANTIPFGTMSSAVPRVGAHDVTIATNANNGYVVTVEYADPDTSGAPLEDGTNNFDSFTGTNATPTTWSSPAGGTANVNTGFVGYSTEDFSLGTGTTNRFQGGDWAGPTTSPLEIVYNASAPSGGTQSTRIGWQAEINTLQPAGNYTGVVILVATPTY